MLSALVDRLEKNSLARTPLSRLHAKVNGVRAIAGGGDGLLLRARPSRFVANLHLMRPFRPALASLAEIYASSETRASAGAQMLCVPARPWILRRRSFTRSAPSCARV